MGGLTLGFGGDLDRLDLSLSDRRRPRSRDLDRLLRRPRPRLRLRLRRRPRERLRDRSRCTLLPIFSCASLTRLMISSSFPGSVLAFGLIIGFVAFPTFKEQSNKMAPVRVRAVFAACVEANSTNANLAGGCLPAILTNKIVPQDEKKCLMCSSDTARLRLPT